MIGVAAHELCPDRQMAPSMIVGAEVAGREFIKSMLLYLPEHTVALIVSDGYAEQAKRDLSRLCANEGSREIDACVWNHSSLPQTLKINPIIAIHSVADPALHQASYLRSQHGKIW